MAAAGAPLITVMDISRVTARAHIPQGDAALLKVGDNATIAVLELDQPVEGKVILVSPALDPNSTTVEVWVQAKNPKQVLKPGSSVRLSMISAAIPEALVVPASALLTGADGATTVMLIGEDQHAHQQAIKTGIRQDDKLQITDGFERRRARRDRRGLWLAGQRESICRSAGRGSQREREAPAGKESDSKDSTKDEKP